MQEWTELEIRLRKFYRTEYQLDLSDTESTYLREAYIFTEKLWSEQLDNITDINFVMLSEAPLFGEKKNYFYNIDTAFSAFFYFKDIEAFDVSYSKAEYNNKDFALKTLRDNGFLILDLFPFALNQHDTQLNFNNINKNSYLKLFKIACDGYLIPKLNLVKEKCSHKTVFLYRYKRLKKRLNGYLEAELIDLDLIQKDEELDTLNNNMSMDRKKLKEIVLSKRFLS